MMSRPSAKADGVEQSPDFLRLMAALEREAGKHNDHLQELADELDRSEAEAQSRADEAESKSAEPAAPRQASIARPASRSPAASPPARSPPPPPKRRDFLAARQPRQSQSLNQPPVEHQFYDVSDDSEAEPLFMSHQRPAAPLAAAPTPPHIDLTLSQSPELGPSSPQARPTSQQNQDETRQDLLRLRRLEIALRDANNFPPDTRILDWARVKLLPQPLLTKDVVRCFVRCRYVVSRSWARLSVAKNQSLVSMLRSQQGCTFFVQMCQFFRQMSRLVAAQRNVTNAQLAELDFQHRRAASFFEQDHLQPSDVLPPRPIDSTPEVDDDAKSIVGDPSFHAAVVIAEACSQPGAVRAQAQAGWELAEQLQGPVASAVNAAFAEIKTWYEWRLRVVPGDLTRVLKDEQALPRFAEWVALLAARERLAFKARYVRNDVTEIINLRTAQARQWLQDYHSNR